MPKIRARGSHTWEITVHYHRCPSCGAVSESREDYHYRLGQYVKDLECPHCHHPYKVVKRARHTLGPFFGP